MSGRVTTSSLASTALKNLPYFTNPAVQTRGRHIEHLGQGYPQYHRVVLRSVDRDAGSSRVNALFGGVTVQEALKVPGVLFVESFTLENADSSAQATRVLELRLRGFTHPRSWDSARKGPSDLLAAWTGYSYQNQGGSADAVGVPITDPQQLQSRCLNPYFTAGDGTALTDFTGDWTLVLAVVCYGDHEMPY